MHYSPVRSILYTSALKKNITDTSSLSLSGVHVWVIDLEDGVPKNKKEEARQSFTNILENYHSSSNSLLAVRINPITTYDGIEDTFLFRNVSCWPSIIVMSMVRDSYEIYWIRELFRSLDRKLNVPKIFVTVECPHAVTNVTKIAQYADGLIFGSADYSASLGIKIGGWEELLVVRSSIVNAAAQYDIPSYDTAYFKLEDNAGLKSEASRARHIGFTGKTAIHPQQVPIINSIFTPTQEEFDEADKLIQRYEQSEQGLLRVDNTMVGPPFYKLAQKIKAQAP